MVSTIRKGSSDEICAPSGWNLINIPSKDEFLASPHDKWSSAWRNSTKCYNSKKAPASPVLPPLPDLPCIYMWSSEVQTLLSSFRSMNSRTLVRTKMYVSAYSSYTCWMKFYIHQLLKSKFSNFTGPRPTYSLSYHFQSCTCIIISLQIFTIF